ncbi:MAG: hypothetical protein KatS3mg035_0089 [Bacteroidia bacterium]|nr:MAG: hypothetical protein KatS3mg035_0089 [Bacteroidia bacterium]
MLIFYQDQKNKKILAVFHKKFLKEKNLHFIEDSHLIIVIRFNNLLITAFWCKDLRNFLQKNKHKNTAVLFPENKKLQNIQKYENYL